MNESLDFSIAYLTRHPESASRVLRSMEVADAAALLQALPADVAAKIIARIGPVPAVRVVRAISPADAASIISMLADNDAAGLLRLLGSAERDDVLGHLPESTRRSVAGSLAYPAGTVGALMTAAVAMLEPTDTVALGLEALRQTASSSDVDLVFLANNAHEPLGAVSAVALLGSPAKARLADIADVSLPAIPARATPAAVAEFEAWQFSRALPVVNRQRQLVGALTYRSLRQNIDPQRDRIRTQSPSILLSMSEDMLDSVIGVWDLLQGSDSGARRSERK
jgi:magnesium transporter